jgi:hypothetical protein
MTNTGHRFKVVYEPGITGQQRGILLAGIPSADPAIGCVHLGNGGIS